MRALSLMPTPPPGLETPSALLPLLVWSKQLLLSPRMRESDAGARIIKLIFEDYVIRLGWQVTLWPEASIQEASRAAYGDISSTGSSSSSSTAAGGKRAAPGAGAAALVLLNSLLSKARQQADLADHDLAAACRHGLVHGPLLAIRYALEGMPWGSILTGAAGGAGGASAFAGGISSSRESGGSGAGMVDQARAWVADLIDLLQRVVTVTLPPMARQDQNITAEDVEEEGGDEDDDNLGDYNGEDDGGEEALGQEPGEAACSNQGSMGPGSAVQGRVTAQQLGPLPQIVNTGCWTSIKEVSACISTIVASIPLSVSALGNSPSSAESTAGAEAQQRAGGSGSESSAPLLSAAQLEAAGSMLLRLLLHLKHNGAVDNVQGNFATLCGQVLRSEVVGLQRLPREWLQRCLEHMTRPGACAVRFVIVVQPL